MHSMQNETKCVVAERCIRTWKEKIYKYVPSTLKNGHNEIIHIMAQLK